jgi:hypothetical protein
VALERSRVRAPSVTLLINLQFAGMLPLVTQRQGTDSPLKLGGGLESSADPQVVPEIESREGHVVVVRRLVETVGSGNSQGQVGEVGLRRARVVDACCTSALENREVFHDERTESR